MAELQYVYSLEGEMTDEQAAEVIRAAGIEDRESKLMEDKT